MIRISVASANFDLDLRKVVPIGVVRLIGDRAAAYARSLVIGRAERGEFEGPGAGVPLSTRTTYTGKTRSFKTSIRSSRWRAMMTTAESYFPSSRSGRSLRLTGGYAEFKRVVGSRRREDVGGGVIFDPVRSFGGANFFLTGKMMRDVQVHSDVVGHGRSDTMKAQKNRAAIIEKKFRFGSKSDARASVRATLPSHGIALTLGVATQESYDIASNLGTRNPMRARRFLFFKGDDRGNIAAFLQNSAGSARATMAGGGTILGRTELGRKKLYTVDF